MIDESRLFEGRQAKSLDCRTGRPWERASMRSRSSLRVIRSPSPSGMADRPRSREVMSFVG